MLWVNQYDVIKRFGYDSLMIDYFGKATQKIMTKINVRKLKSILNLLTCSLTLVVSVHLILHMQVCFGSQCRVDMI